MKICIECKHCSYREPTGMKKLFPFLVQVDDWAEFSHCMHDTAKFTTAISNELVTGEPDVPNKNDYSFCGTMRKLENKKYCGPEGRFWEPK